MRALNKVFTGLAYTTVLFFGMSCDRSHDRFGSELRSAPSLEQSWKQGCFQVDAALLAIEEIDKAVSPRDTAGIQPVHVKVALLPDGKCPDLKGGSADVVTGFGATAEEVDQRVSIFDNALRRNFWLVTKEGRIHPSLYLMERTYGMADGRTFLLSFPLKKDQREAFRAGSGLELAFEIPVKGAGVAILRWPAETMRKII